MLLMVLTGWRAPRLAPPSGWQMDMSHWGVCFLGGTAEKLGLAVPPHLTGKHPQKCVVLGARAVFVRRCGRGWGTGCSGLALGSTLTAPMARRYREVAGQKGREEARSRIESGEAATL